MHWRRACPVIAPALLAAACSPPQEAVVQAKGLENSGTG